MSLRNHVFVAAFLVLASASAVAGCGKSKGTGSGTSAAVELGEAKSLGTITVQAPKSWTETPVTSQMRRAQWSIGPEGSAAELVIFYFGAGGAGPVQANLDRWFGQFQQPDGKPSSEVAKVATSTVNGMNVTRAEVAGRYVAEVRPGAGQRVDNPDWALLGAIVESEQGAYYFKMVGPKATVDQARDGFDAMLGSLRKSAP